MVYSRCCDIKKKFQSLAPINYKDVDQGMGIGSKLMSVSLKFVINTSESIVGIIPTKCDEMLRVFS